MLIVRYLYKINSFQLFLDTLVIKTSIRSELCWIVLKDIGAIKVYT